MWSSYEFRTVSFSTSVPFALLLSGNEKLSFLSFNSIRLPLTMDSQWALQ